MDQFSRFDWIDSVDSDSVFFALKFVGLFAVLPVLMKMSRYNFFWFCKIFKTLREILRYNFVKLYAIRLYHRFCFAIPEQMSAIHRSTTELIPMHGFPSWNGPLHWRSLVLSPGPQVVEQSDQSDQVDQLPSTKKSN